MAEREHGQLSDAVDLLQARFGSLGDGFGRIHAAWRAAVGPDVSRFTMPTSLRNGELRVRCADASWTSEILHQTPELLHRLRIDLGGDAPKRIKPTTGRIPVPERQAPASAPPLPPLPRGEADAIHSTVEQLPAGSVRDSVERAMQRAAQRRRNPAP